MDFSISDIKKLENLLKTESDDDSDIEKDLPRPGFVKLGPGDVGPPKREDVCSSGSPRGEGPVDPQSIWRDEEVGEGLPCDDDSDPRPQPEYDVTYRQTVGAEDLYLGLGAKTPATSSCEALVLTLRMPGEMRAHIDLQVTKTRVEVRSPRYRLSLALPHPVDPDWSRAHWNEEDKSLTVTVRMDRELDFLNF